jgi:chromate transporter
VSESPGTETPLIENVSFREAVVVWARIGLLGFGGPAGQVALMHKELVERRRWIDEERFLHALNYCMLLPGPEAQQLAIYIGWLLHKTPGGLVAGVLFVLPGALAILVLSVLYAELRQLPAIAALFFGLKAAVVAVVVEAVLRIGKRALKSRVLIGVAASAFIALFLLHVPFPLIVLGAALFGLLGSRLRPQAFPAPKAAATSGEHVSLIEGLARAGQLEHTRPNRARAWRVLMTCSLLWALPLLALGWGFGLDSVFVKEGLFFSQAAVVTFGGAYAVLAYIAQRAVSDYGWLLPGEMLDGLGLAETTPGPLILVVQFVGFMGAYRNPGVLPPLAAGVLGALVTLWVTFVPCFLWILLGAPYIEALRGRRSIHAALSAITAAVVGVILNLSLWFGLHVLFRRVSERQWGPLHVLVPDPSSVDLAATILTALALLAMLRFKLGLPKTLAGCAGLGLAWRLLAAP